MKQSLSRSCLFAVCLCLAASVRGADLPDVAARGSVGEVRRLLDSGVSVDAKADKTGWTALIAAVWADKPDVVKLLLDRGAKPDLGSKTGYTPLMAATQTRNAALLRLLLRRGANPNVSTPQGLTPLMVAAGNAADARTEAADLQSVKLLLRAGADPKRAHRSGATALAVAEKRGKVAVAAYLRSVKDSPDTKATTVAATGGTITGTVAYRERIAVSPAAFSVVRLLNVSGKSPIVVAQSVTPFAGKQVPVPFTLPYKGAVAGARFAVDARIVFGGAAQFRTAAPVPVLQGGTSGKNVALTLIRTTPADQAALATEAIAATDKAIAASGTTRTGSTRVGEIATSFTASFLGGRLVRIVARSAKSDYGDRADRYYFGEGSDRGNTPALRAAFLDAKRAARTTPPIGGGMSDTQVIPGKFEQVTQRIFLLDNGDTASATKTVDGAERTVSPLDITAARNFARILSAAVLR